jgi:hypothetical protein
MKRVNYLFAVCCLMAASVFSSCLSSDDDNNTGNGLTKSQIDLCAATVRGDYQGQLIYYSPDTNNPEDITDTLNIVWRIPNDSTLYVPNFPTRLLANQITYEPLKLALMEQPDVPLNCYIGFIYADPIEFLINPIVLDYDLHYANADHKVQVLFYYNSYDSFGRYDSSSRQLKLQIIEGAIYVDGMQTTYLSPIPFLFISQSKF